MGNLAKAQIIGRLGRDVELKYSQQGVAVATFSVATNERTTRNGETQEKVLWWRVTAFNKLAENCNQYLSKGSEVWIDGQPSYEEFTDRDGNKRFTLTLRANEVQFLGSKGEAQAAAASAPKSNAKPASKQAAADDFDVPF